jgi:hypothetical protein
LKLATVVNFAQIPFANERMLDPTEAPARSGRAFHSAIRSTGFGAKDNGPEHGRIEKVGSWMQDTYIESGWATFPGMTAPDRGVAQACANLLTASLG